MKSLLRILLCAVIGPFTLYDFLTAEPSFHRRLANTRRQRKQAVNYPLKLLS